MLGVQSLHLFEDDKGDADGADDCEGNESHDEAQQRVGNDERQDGTACSDGCPGNVATTEAHEFKGSLQPLENWVLRVAGVHCTAHLESSDYTVFDAEEQRQGLGSGNQEDTCADDHHDRLLENLPIICKCLIHSYIEKAETTKGTKWEQKIQKPQNENIYLTNLNMENNGNFPILSF